MTTPIRILGIPGSLRKASFNKAALRAAQQVVPEGATLEIFELNGIPVLYPVNRPEVFIGSAATKFDERGELKDETARDLIRQLLEKLVAWTRRLGASG